MHNFDDAVVEILVYDLGKKYHEALDAIRIAREEDSGYYTEDAGVQEVAQMIFENPRYWLDSEPS